MSRAVALLIFATGAAQASDLRYPAPLGPYQSADRVPARLAPALGDRPHPGQDRVAHAEFTYTSAPESPRPERYDASYTEHYGDPWTVSEARSAAIGAPDLGHSSRSGARIARDTRNTREQSYYPAEADRGLAYPEPEPRSLESYPASMVREYGYRGDPTWCCERGQEPHALDAYRYEPPTRSREAAYPQPSESNRQHDQVRSGALSQGVYAPTFAYARSSQPVEPLDYRQPGRLDMPAADQVRRSVPASAPQRWSDDYAGHIAGSGDQDRYAVTWDRDPWDAYTLPRAAISRAESSRSAGGRPDPAPREVFETIYWSPDWELGYGMKPAEYGMQRELYSDAPAAPFFAPEYQESFYFRSPESTGRH